MTDPEAVALYRSARKEQAQYRFPGKAAQVWQWAKGESQVRRRAGWLESVVRVEPRPDESAALEDLACDPGCFDRDSDYQRHLKETADRAYSEGVFGIVGEYLDPESGEWIQADSCWGFIGEDWKGSGYDSDALHLAIQAWRDARQDQRDRRAMALGPLAIGRVGQ